MLECAVTLGPVLQGCVVALDLRRRDIFLTQTAGVHSIHNCVVLRADLQWLQGYEGPWYCLQVQHLRSRLQWWLEPVMCAYLVAGASYRCLCSGRGWLQTHMYWWGPEQVARVSFRHTDVGKYSCGCWVSPSAYGSGGW